ncbi:MAG: hydrogenase small subunit [Anaerolineae bacterium]
MEATGGSVWDLLRARSVSRRGFLRFCTAMGATLALPEDMTPRIVEALETNERLPVIWLHGQGCTADDESFIRVGEPDITRVVLDIISLEYSQTLMADAGASAESKLTAAIERYAGRYLVVQEGSVPTGENAYYCTVAGRSCEDILRETTRNCAGIIAIGACASWGGWPASRPNPTGAKGVHQIITDKPVINLTGCPHNGINSVATIVYYLTFGQLPPVDARGRPLFAHGKRIHDNCERRAHFDAGQFVEKWGDEGHRQGWCLYKMGCKGPQAYYNCPVERWNSGTSWPVRSGHGCIACAAFDFWDSMTPFYGRLPQVPLFPVETTVDRIGLALTAAAILGVAAHAAGTAIWRARRGDQAPPPEPPAPETTPTAASGTEPAAPASPPAEEKSDAR